MLDFFELFELPRRFSLDESLLKKQFLKLQKAWHPDNFSAADESQKNAALIQSANINEGFSVLENPAKRAKHLLELLGEKIGDENRAMPAEFLAEQFALHESLDIARQTRDLAQLELLFDSVEMFETQRLKNLEKFLDVSPDPKSAIENLNALLFLQKLKANIESAMAELE